MAENSVVMHGHEFVLEEPSTDVVIRIMNVIGSVAIRAEGTAARVVKSPTNRAVLFALLAVMHQDDLVRLGSAVLQFEDDRKGRKWINEQGVKVAPLVKALLINLRLSDDLVEALKAFFDGIAGIEALIEALVPETSEEESAG